MRTREPRHRYVAARPLPTRERPRLGPRRFAYHAPVQPHPGITNFLRRLVLLGIALVGLGVVGTLGYKLVVEMQTRDSIYAPNDPKLPQRHVALVFGAGLNSAGGPSAMLYDRVATAADLYASGMVNKLLMTGDNGSVNHNEVEAMRRTALDLGVKYEDIVLDYAGFNTWDSCYRAREVFSLAEATLVTQRFHLPRAIYTCKQLGIDAIGVTADRQNYHTFSNEMRELPALVGTAFRMMTNDKPRFLGPKINIDEPQE